MKTECNQPIEGREGRSTRFVGGQKNSILTVGQWIGVIGGWLNQRIG
jgi:hypothetical protein